MTVDLVDVLMAQLVGPLADWLGGCARLLVLGVRFNPKPGHCNILLFSEVVVFSCVIYICF